MLLLKNLINPKGVIQDIHNEFDNAQENLLKEALKIINANPIEKLSKAERLEKIGFVNASSVKSYKKKKKLLVENQKQAELIQYYKTNYPFLKFLTESELDRICDKYSLIYAPINRYIKDVPEKNISEIENAQGLKSNDIKPTNFFLQVHKPWSDAPKDLKKILSEGFYVDTNFKPDDYNVLKYAKTHGGYTGSYSGYTISSSNNAATVTKTSFNNLFIAAPKSDFDLSGLDKKGKGFFKTQIFEIKDPIVFRYVKGGIQVITKWGLEANDEALTIDILN